MLILGIETATDFGSVAIVEDTVLRGQVSINKRNTHSKNIIQSIDFLLCSLEMKGENLDGIAVSIGPGSFTGLRVGLSVAKTLSFCWEKPLLAANSLDSLAQLGRRQMCLICPLIRFRRNEYYYAYYSWQNEKIERQSDYQAAYISEIVEKTKNPAIFLGILFNEDKIIIKDNKKPKTSFFHEFYPSAYWVAFLGAENLARNITEDIRNLKPFYMFDFPIKA